MRGGCEESGDSEHGVEEADVSHNDVSHHKDGVGRDQECHDSDTMGELGSADEAGGIGPWRSRERFIVGNLRALAAVARDEEWEGKRATSRTQDIGAEIALVCVIGGRRHDDDCCEHRAECRDHRLGVRNADDLELELELEQAAASGQGRRSFEGPPVGDGRAELSCVGLCRVDATAVLN